MTMELGQEFSLQYAFGWDEPIAGPVQQAISMYGNDEDRIRLAGHFSVSRESLEAMADVPTPEVQLAVAANPATPVEALAKMASDRSRFVRAAALNAIEQLPGQQRDAAKAMMGSVVQRLRSRLSA
ncbi:MAG TPA: hypothetical protein VGF80_02240 [Galbitalea sp.]|jgi:hypothetical protein